MPDFLLNRICTIMEPRANDPHEIEGVLNPAAIRGPDGQLYLFPRLVAQGNYSRIGVARVLFDSAGDPREVERMGIALEPEADYEFNDHGGGCEDPRISFIEPLRRYVMTYTAFSRRGPRIAIAISENLISWRRLGLAIFQPYNGVSFEGVDDKDASMFPTPIRDPAGGMAFAIVHRPLFPGTRPEETVHKSPSRSTDSPKECIWISYCRVDAEGEARHVHEFVAHRRLACPKAAWERLKIGGGAPPVMSRHGWLMFYHGVHNMIPRGGTGHKLCYSAGAMLLSRTRPTRIIDRSATPALTPEGPLEQTGTVENVVFPTGVDRRDDLGAPDRFDVYYGMADDRIGVARLDLPEVLSN